MTKVAGCENPADLLTKHLDKKLHEKHVDALGLSIVKRGSEGEIKADAPIVACWLSRFHDPDLAELANPRGGSPSGL